MTVFFERNGWSTLVAHSPEQPAPLTFFTQGAYISDETPYQLGAPYLVYEFGQLERPIPLTDYEVLDAGRACVTTDRGSWAEIREVREPDASTIRAGANWPISVLTNYLEGGLVPEELKALVDDNGYVVTMFLASEAGLFVRFSGAWHALPPTDPSEVDPIDGLNVVDVTNDALAVFDMHDLRGEQPNVGMMPLAPGEDIGQFSEALLNEANQAQRTTDQAAEETVVASGMVPIHSAGDLDQAIVLAQEDDSMRWYVERRARALGLEDQLPWGDDA